MASRERRKKVQVTGLHMEIFHLPALLRHSSTASLSQESAPSFFPVQAPLFPPSASWTCSSCFTSSSVPEAILLFTFLRNPQTRTGPSHRHQVLPLPCTSGFVELQCHPCIKTKAEVVIKDIQRELKWKGRIRMRLPACAHGKDEVSLQQSHYSAHEAEGPCLPFP